MESAVMRNALLLVLLSQPALADFTIVSEATVDGHQQLTTISLRGTMLRVSIETAKTPTTVILRDTTTGITVISDEPGRAQRIVDLPDPAVVPTPGERLSYRFERQPSKRRLVGVDCVDHLATASQPALSFGACYAPWTAIGLEPGAFARLFPTGKTLALYPLLTLMTTTWTGMHPSFAGELPGVPLQKTQQFWSGPTTKLASRVRELRTTALAVDLFHWPTIPDGGPR